MKYDFLQNSQMDIQTERDTYNKSRLGLNALCEETEKVLNDQVQMRLVGFKNFNLVFLFIYFTVFTWIIALLLLINCQVYVFRRQILKLSAPSK